MSHPTHQVPAGRLAGRRPDAMSVTHDKSDVRALKVLLADEDKGALRVTAGLLRELGHEVTEMAIGVQEAADMIARAAPDASIVVVDQDDGHALDLIDEISEFARGPVIAIVEKEDPEFVAEAAKRGIPAYGPEGRAESIQAAIEVAMRRHEEKLRLVDQIQRLEAAPGPPAPIERAKGILLERPNVSEAEAFDLLPDPARSRNRTVVDVAASVSEGHA